MNDNILISIKELLGIQPDCVHFDNTIKMHINSVLFILEQLGYETVKGYSLKTGSETWSEIIKNPSDTEAIKTYIYLKVRMLFDPPQSSAIAEANRQAINELESRINFHTELNKGGGANEQIQ